MSSFNPANASAAPANNQMVTFRLYVAGGAPNSLEAIANLKSLCEEYLPNIYQIEIVDMLQEPLRAMSDGVFMTPMLIKVSPAPSQQMIGNLSARDAVISALGLNEYKK